MTNTDDNQREQLNREDRVALKRKGTLRCEWCNRWTVVDYDLWDANHGTFYIYFCPRERCLSGRSEAMDQTPLLRMHKKKK